MGFLQRFLKSTYREGDPAATQSSFLELTEEQLESHLSIARYGSFVLTDAVRPSYDLQVVPRAGYRHDVYQDKESGVKIPVLMAAVSRELLAEVAHVDVDAAIHSATAVWRRSWGRRPA